MVVPQFLGRVDFVLELEALALQVGAQFVEIALVSDPVDAVARFVCRTQRPENDGHRDAAILLERNGGLGGLPQMYERLVQVIAARPATRTVVTVDGEIDSTYRRVLEQIEAGKTSAVERSALPAPGKHVLDDVEGDPEDRHRGQEDS